MTNTKLFIRFLFYLFLIIKFSHANAQDYVEVRGNQINYEIKGHGEPWVIFITGYGDPMSSFDSVFDKTADLTTVVRYSRAGLGKSSYDFKGKDIDVIIQELESFIRILNVPKPFILIGHSYGGLIGRSYSKRYSERVCGLLLDDPTFEDYFEKLSKHEKNAKTIETKDNENWLNTDTSKSARDEFESLWKVWHSPKK